MMRMIAATALLALAACELPAEYGGPDATCDDLAAEMLRRAALLEAETSEIARAVHAGWIVGLETRYRGCVQ